ncbi:endoribonuclease Dcr-2 isoform X2 [Nomia melanderi]
MMDDENDFRPRAYQLDLYEVAAKQNTIIYLPTGSGKTFIAVMLIKKLSADIRKPYNEGGKHTVFLVNTVPLVLQQAEYIARLTGLSCTGISGDMGVDFWKENQWNEQLKNHHVLVMTCQILLNGLNHGFMFLNKINLLILDECHRAVNNHPMRLIMKLFEFCPEEEQPKVLGLTATLLNANTMCNNIDTIVRSLEITLHAKIATVNSELQLQNYYAAPRESFCRFDNYIVPQVGTIINNRIAEINDCLDCILLKNSLTHQDSSIQFRPKSITKKLINILEDIKEQFAHAGLYGASKAILLHMIQLECLKKYNSGVDAAYIFEYLISELTIFRKLLDDEMKDDSDTIKIMKYSSDQVQNLFKILLDFHENKSTECEFCCIIFVQRRFTAQVLYHILKNLSAHNKKFHFLKPDFMMGFSCDPYKCSRETSCISKWNKEVLHRFKNGFTNCLIATDVIDEGIDIPTCTLVIRYNLPMDIRSYIQSKGRARHSASQYTFLLSNSDKNYVKRFESYKMVESHLKKLLVGQTEYRKELTNDDMKNMLYVHEIEPYIVTSSDGTKCSITENTAISLINMYCLQLLKSKFAYLSPTWILYKIEERNKQNKTNLYQVSLKLPILSPLKTTVFGNVMSSINSAKRSVAMKMCIELHKIGELTDSLIPRTFQSVVESTDYLFPNWEVEDKSDAGIIGTYKKKRHHELQFPSALYGAYPLPSKPVYLHLLRAKPMYPAPHYDNRRLVFYNLLSNKAGFGILSSKEMPQIPSFPIFMNVGELQVDVEVNYAKMNLSATEIGNIKIFHSLIFSQVVPVIKPFMIFDNYNLDNCFLIAPVNEKWEIDWDIIQEHQQIQHIPPPVPFQFEHNDYDLALVVPNYRAAAEVYIITQICEELTPNSCFPSENFFSYVHYYKQKHGLTVHNLTQPMLEAKMVSKKINCIKPRSMQSESKYRKRMEMNEDLKEHLVPEFCTIVKFPALYWLKATMLPSILHRISQLLIAEDLRRLVSEEANLVVEYNVNHWPPLEIREEEIDILEPPKKVICNEDVENLQSEPVLSGPEIDVLNTDAYHYPWTKDEEPPELFRKIEDIRMIDIEHYCQFMTSGCDEDVYTTNIRKFTFMDRPSVPVRELKILSVENSGGPSPVQITYALTSKLGNDAFDLERLETLGDSCLKFVVSLFLYTFFPNYNEGPLTALKGKLIGNRNLYYCGKKKCIPGRMKVDDFVPLSNFIPPAYSAFRQLQKILLDTEVSPNVLYEIEIPEKEKFSGCLSKSTETAIKSKVLNWDVAETQTGMELYLGIQIVADKTVADCVEALIGVYLSSMGIKSTVNLLTWFEILPKDIDINALLFTVPKDPEISEDVDYLIPWASNIEQKLGYKFENRAFLLQAFTHPSYSANSITECYQRLEFLGDAVIDFLITSYIYEYCGNLSPGVLTDLRSALVNNITFACLSVRYGLHTALLAYSPQLNDAINRFVKFQEERGHVVNDELLWILMEEKECNMVEYVDVPKVLGDIFESTIGAIYMDSGKNLKKVWEIIFSLMHTEIDEFSKNIPKQPIRVLYEHQGARPQFLNAVPVEGTSSIMVSLEVFIAGKIKRFHGFGSNKKLAKCAAAKLALKHLLRKN